MHRNDSPIDGQTNDSTNDNTDNGTDSHTGHRKDNRAGHEAAAPLSVRIMALPHAAGLELPAYASAQAAGMDLLAATEAADTLTLPPGARALVPTGIAIALPPGYEAQVRPRSGLAAKQGVTVLNAPGTIDADYRGEVKVILVNLGQEPFTVTRGMRIAQMVVARYTTVMWEKTENLDETARGAGGFGSTGTK